LEVCVDAKKIIFYDGMGKSCTRWRRHFHYVLQRCCLLPVSLTFKDWQKSKWDGWAMDHKFFLEQRNDYDCGPLVCLKLMHVYGRVSQEVVDRLKQNFSSQQLRKLVAEDYWMLVDLLKDTLTVACSREREAVLLSDRGRRNQLTSGVLKMDLESEMF
jgi:Ulp1 protease family, C-terminal catalytic domain